MGEIIVEKGSEDAYNIISALYANGFNPITEDQLKSRLNMINREKQKKIQQVKEEAERKAQAIKDKYI